MKKFSFFDLNSGNILIEYNFDLDNSDLRIDLEHDTYLICNGVRPKIPDFMLNWIPGWYLDFMYRCWSDDPSEHPTSFELSELFLEIYEKILYDEVDDNVMRRQLEISNKSSTSSVNTHNIDEETESQS
ncbi:hypothetical protein Glove_476g1 [Diversispora epigaea]|uniref:Serine-threonine/tyrosine-protein kinase catalytic domain-containing protein n=1 Tax=Diversispora epigaea TaxID=1348612 RepID=A0A397GPI2_9GLOM|nr:hypothetical protein Glove_476g1 [Diversispora epigaea]